VAQAFASFAKSYAADVKTILFASGTTNPSTNRPAFDTAVGTLLTSLNTTIAADVANLPTATSLKSTIQGQILGTTATSLQGALAEVASPTTNTRRAAFTFSFLAAIDIGQTAAQVTAEVRSAPAPSGTIPGSTVFGDMNAIHAAFQTFGQTYSTDISTILNPTGTTNPSANRSAFDSAIGSALATLQTNVNAAIANLPTSVTTSLATTIQSDLLTGTSTTGTSLQSILAALASPTTSKSSLRAFQAAALLDASIAEGKIEGSVIVAVSRYNSALGTSITT
jgi:hypothetical protein